jgi:hypothetical protein
MRVWKGVYCESEFETAVNAELENFRLLLQSTHPEWKFDTDGPDWEEAEGDDYDAELL